MHSDMLSMLNFNHLKHNYIIPLYYISSEVYFKLFIIYKYWVIR